MRTEISASLQSRDGASASFALEKSALWRHYWRQLWTGLALCGFVTLSAIIYKLASAKAGYTPTDTTYIKTDFGRLTSDYLWLGVMFLFCCSTAAALGGLLRHSYLAWLSKRARSRSRLVWGSLLGFEVSTVLAAVLYWWATGSSGTGQPLQALGYTVLACFVISLPWRLAEVWSARRLAMELRMPPHAPSPTLVRV